MEEGTQRATASGAEPAKYRAVRQLGELRRLLLERARLQAELETCEAALAYHLRVLTEGVP
jgi:hypothetical protein